MKKSKGSQIHLIEVNSSKLISEIPTRLVELKKHFSGLTTFMGWSMAETKYICTEVNGTRFFALYVYDEDILLCKVTVANEQVHILASSAYSDHVKKHLLKFVSENEGSFEFVAMPEEISF